MSGQSLGTVLLEVAFSLLSISTLFVVFRFYCRHFIVKKIGIDDWIMLVALFTVWGIGVLNWYQVDTGTGTHVADLPSMNDPNQRLKVMSEFVTAMKVWYIYQLMYLIALLWVKLSVLTFYRRLSQNWRYQVAILLTGGFVTTYTIIMVFINAFECTKPSDAWNPLAWPHGCRDLVPIYYGQAWLNIVSDIIILLLPVPTLLNLQITQAKRVMLVLIFSGGGLAVIASIVRIIALYNFHHSKDPLYDGGYILLWSQVELNAAVISSSAPALKPLVKLMAERGVFSLRSAFLSRSSQGRSIGLRYFGGVNKASISSDDELHIGRGETKKDIIATVNESKENIIGGECV